MTPTRDSRLLRTTILLFFLVALGYGIFEAQGLISGPSITLERETFTVAEPFITLEGKAERISELRINGARVPVTETGAFKESLLAVPGTNFYIVEARDARGRTDTRTVTVIYPTSTPTAYAQPTSDIATTTDASPPQATSSATTTSSESE